MRSAWRLYALISGLVICLTPAVGQASIVYRMGGNGCAPAADEFVDYLYDPHYGLTVSGSGDLAKVVCALPTSESTFTASTLSQVNVRYYAHGGLDGVYATLTFHDYDSYAYVECEEDRDTDLSFSFGTLELPKSCSGYESNWPVVVEVVGYGVETFALLNV